MVLANGAVDASLIVGSIPDEGGEWNCSLLEQGANLRAIIDIARGRLRGEDLPHLSIDADVQLSPGAPLLWVPCFSSSHSSAQGRVIRHSQIQPQELKDRARQAFRLTQRQPGKLTEVSGLS
jgi:hypothetical protein